MHYGSTWLGKDFALFNRSLHRANSEQEESHGTSRQADGDVGELSELT